MQERDRERCRKTLAWLRRTGVPATGSDYAQLDRATEWVSAAGSVLVAATALVGPWPYLLVGIPAGAVWVGVLTRLVAAKRFLRDRRTWNLADPTEGTSPPEPSAIPDHEIEHCRQVLATIKMCVGKPSSETDLASLEKGWWSYPFVILFLAVVQRRNSCAHASLVQALLAIGLVSLVVLAVAHFRRTARARHFLITHRAWNLAEVGPRPDHS